MVNQQKSKHKRKTELYSTHTGEKVTGRIINDQTAKVIFDDGTSHMLYLSFTSLQKEVNPEMYCDDEGFEYVFSVLNFIQEGYVPYEYYTIIDNPTPDQLLISKIKEVLDKTSYRWSAKDRVTLSKVPVKTKKDDYWVNTHQLFVRVNGLTFGSTVL